MHFSSPPWKGVTGVTYKNATNLYNTAKPLTKPCTTLTKHFHQIVQSEKNIKSGLLLLTPTEHDRFEHYDGNLRKES